MTEGSQQCNESYAPTVGERTSVFAPYLHSPSTPFVVELSRLFHVTTDYLLGLDDCLTIRTDNLTEREISVLLNTIECFYNSKEK